MISFKKLKNNKLTKKANQIPLIKIKNKINMALEKKFEGKNF